MQVKVMGIRGPSPTRVPLQRRQGAGLLSLRAHVRRGHVRSPWTGGCLQPKGRALTRYQPAGTLGLDLQPPELK